MIYIHIEFIPQIFGSSLFRTVIHAPPRPASFGLFDLARMCFVDA